MPNSLLTPSLITKETLVILANNLVAAGKVNRQFENQFVKIGSSLTIRKPNRFTVSSGPGLAIQNIVEPSTSITVSSQRHVDFLFTTADLTLAIEEFSERYCKPASEAIANVVDLDVLANVTQVSNFVGTSGVVPATFAALAAVGQRMDEAAAPQDGRVLILNSAAYWAMANGLIGVFVRSVAEPALKGYLANIANFEIYQDQNIPTQTVGTLGGTGAVFGASQTGSNIITNGWTANITNLLRAGDVVTFGTLAAGVFAINPQSRVSTQALKTFVVTANVSSDAGGNATIPISPAITTSGAYQTVSNSPANGAAVTVATGTTGVTRAQNIAFCRDAFGLVMVPLELPQGVDFAAREMVKNISMRLLRFYDGNNDTIPCRIDVLYGSALWYDDLACRLTN